MNGYIVLDFDQRRKLMGYVILSFFISLILSSFESFIEGVEFLTTLGLGSFITDFILVGFSEFLTRKFQEHADKRGVPYVNLKNRGRSLSYIINFLPGITYIRFGVENLIPALTGRVKALE